MNNLFYDSNLVDHLKYKIKECKEEIDKIPRTNISSENQAKLVSILEEKYILKTPSLKINEIQISEPEDVTIERDNNLPGFNDIRQIELIPGSTIKIYFPFDGHRELFYFTPSNFGSRFPQGILSDNEIVIYYSNVQLDKSILNSIKESTLKQFEQWLIWVSIDVDKYNSELKNLIQSQINKRIERTSHDKNVIKSIGLPIRQKKDTDLNYIFSDSRKNIDIINLVQTLKLPEQEYEIGKDDYESILKIMKNMSLVMEKCPKAFEKLDEESIRFHFLFLLNGIYEGQATGETFNYKGKTDILITHNGKNLFIAECKFWSGAEKFNETIDQLLGYLSWRDTKTAIILFNRNRNFTSVLHQIPNLVKDHNNFDNEIIMDEETEFRYILHRTDDKAQTITLTILAFDVPS